MSLDPVFWHTFQHKSYRSKVCHDVHPRKKLTCPVNNSGWMMKFPFGMVPFLGDMFHTILEAKWPLFLIGCSALMVQPPKQRTNRFQDYILYDHMLYVGLFPFPVYNTVKWRFIYRNPPSKKTYWIFMMVISILGRGGNWLDHPTSARLGLISNQILGRRNWWGRANKKVGWTKVLALRKMRGCYTPRST